jgi:hypothetical protein
MSNVVELFAEKGVEKTPPGATASITATAAVVLELSAQLGHTVKDLSKHFDAIDTAVAAIDNTEVRSQFEQVTRLSREALSRATLVLSQKISKLPGLQMRAILKD